MADPAPLEIGDRFAVAGVVGSVVAITSTTVTLRYVKDGGTFDVESSLDIWHQLNADDRLRAAEET